MPVINEHIEKANRITLKNIVNKTSVTLSHQFADVTTRDAYFVTNPTELQDNLFIKVGTGYQQYLNNAWEDVSAVLVEQAPASLQRVEDVGEHYASDNVEGALQEVGEQINDLAVNVKNFGAKGDWNGTTGTDDTLAIRVAITSIASYPKATLFFSHCLGYCVSDTIQIPANINVIMEAPLIYTATDNKVCLEIGSNTESTKNCKFKLQVVRKAYSDWVSESCVGIKLINMATSKIDIVASKNFTIGVQEVGYNTGFAYNEIHYGEIGTNKIGVDLVAGGTTGWNNENIRYNGRFTVESTINNGLARYGVRITKTSNNMLNNNVWYKPSFEIGEAQSLPSECIPILIEHGYLNYFYDIRNEGSGAYIAKILNDSSNNYFEIGYASSTAQEAKVLNGGNYSNNIGKSRVYETQNYNKYQIYSVRNLHKKMCAYNAGNYHMQGVFAEGASETSPTIGAYLTRCVQAENYVEITNGGIGVWVDTSQIKRFYVTRDAETGYGGRVYVVCYDANGAVLTSASANHPLVKGSANQTFGYVTTFGGSYSENADHDYGIFFTVHEDVKKIQLMLVKGTNALRIRGFSVYAISLYPNDIQPRVWTGFEEEKLIATQIPTFGIYDKGQTIYNADTDATEYIGWVCVVGGMFKVITAGTTGSTTSGTNILTVNTIANLKLGDYITIAGVTGTKKITNIVNTTITLSSNADATVADAVISNSVPSFKGFGVIQS